MCMCVHVHASTCCAYVREEEAPIPRSSYMKAIKSSVRNLKKQQQLTQPAGHVCL